MALSECLLLDKQSDIEKILLEFKNELFNKTITSTYLKKLAKKFAVSAVFMILREDEENKGYVAFYCNDYTNYRAFISMIVVKAEFQHKGVAKRLLREAIKMAKKAHMKKISLEVAKNNDVAQNFYKKQGFFFGEETEKAYFMEKKIG